MSLSVFSFLVYRNEFLYTNSFFLLTVMSSYCLQASTDSEKISTLNLLRIPCTRQIVSLLLLQDFHFVFDYLHIVYVSIWVFLSFSNLMFVEHGECVIHVSSKSWEISAIIYSKFFLAFFFSLSLTSGSPIMCILAHLMVSLRFCLLLSLFLSFCSSDFIHSTVRFQVCWFTLRPAQISCWTLLVNFLFHLFYFSILVLLFCSFL